MTWIVDIVRDKRLEAQGMAVGVKADGSRVVAPLPILMAEMESGAAAPMGPPGPSGQVFPPAPPSWEEEKARQRSARIGFQSFVPAGAGAPGGTGALPLPGPQQVPPEPPSVQLEQQEPGHSESLPQLGMGLGDLERLGAPAPVMGTDVTTTVSRDLPPGSADKLMKVFDNGVGIAKSLFEDERTSRRKAYDKAAHDIELERAKRQEMHLQEQAKVDQFQRDIEARLKTPVREQDFWSDRGNTGIVISAILLARGGFGTPDGGKLIVDSVNRAVDRWMNQASKERSEALRMRSEQLRDARQAQASLRADLLSLGMQRIKTELAGSDNLDLAKAEAALQVERSKVEAQFRASSEEKVQKVFRQREKEQKRTGAPAWSDPKQWQEFMGGTSKDPGVLTRLQNVERSEKIYERLKGLVKGGSLPGKGPVEQFVPEVLHRAAARFGVQGSKDYIEYRRLVTEMTLGLVSSLGTKLMDSDKEKKLIEQMMDPATTEQALAGLRDMLDQSQQGIVDWAAQHAPEGVAPEALIAEAMKRRSLVARKDGAGGSSRPPLQTGETGETGLRSLSQELQTEIEAVATEHGYDPRLVGAIIYGESGGNPAAKNPNPKSTARGLFQAIDDTAKALGYADSADLASRPASEQLRAYMRYLDAAGGPERIRTPADYLLVQAAPGRFKRGEFADPDAVVFRLGSREYEENQGWDTDRDGVITVRDMQNHRWFR